MDGVYEFMNIFERCWTARQGDELSRLFGDGYKYFRDLPKHKKALALTILFSDSKGLLTFLAEEMDNPNNERTFCGAICKGFHFLEFLIKEYLDFYEPYLITTKRVCITAIIMSTMTEPMRRAACAALLLIIKHFPNIELQFNETIKEWLSKIKVYSKKELPYMYRIISAVAHYHPYTPSIAQYSDAILRAMMSNFYETYGAITKDKLNSMELILETLTEMFHKYPLKNYTELDKFYKLIKELTIRAEKLKNILILKLLLRLMIGQMSMFNNFILIDHSFWYEYFDRLRNDTETRELASNALKVYYEVMGKLLNEDNSNTNPLILHSLKGKFVRNLTDEVLDFGELRLMINGYSQIVEAVKKSYNDAAVEEIFTLIVSRTLPLFFSEDEASDRFEDLIDYQEALSRILQHMTNVSMHHMKILSKFCTLLIKRFPELPSSSQEFALNSLKTTLSNVKSLKNHLSQEFITTIIFDGIVWSCSHSLFVDAELKRDLEQLTRRPVTYKDYVTFWKGLLNSQNYKIMFGNEISLAQQVVNEIIETFINLTEKLNLNIKTREDNLFSDLALSHIAENQTDFRIFLNMIDLYDEILEDIDPHYLTDKLSRIFYKIIQASYRHPLLSGFYRIIDRLLTVSCYFDEDVSMDTELYKMVLQYLQNVLNDVCQFPRELQVSCVLLILHSPKPFIARLIDQMVPIFKIALTIGLSDYDIANTALNTLEKYTTFAKNWQLNNFVKELLPSLELFLRSKESNQIIDEPLNERKVILNITEEGLEELQKRILLFIGRLEQKVVDEFLHQQSLNTQSSWDKKDLLKYSLDFPDLSLDVYLDTILPRIIELALNCSDRRTKVAACEVLHSAVAILLGKTIQFLSAEPDRFASIYKSLCPALLKLGCDCDEVVMRLFNPLMLQITHWLSSKVMLHSPAVCYLIDSLFDGLSDETNFALRDFSGICLAEFTKWSIKQISDQELSRAPININTIVEYITNFALHPSHRRRVAAAIAFNYLHSNLSSNEEVINIFWFELLYCFVKSINGCSDPNIWQACSHIKLVLVRKSRIFNQHDTRRKIPTEFQGDTMINAVNWLLSQCGVVDNNARKKAMQLFAELVPTVTKYNSAKSIVTAFVENNGIQELNKIILRDLDDTKHTISIEHLENLLRSLDCYTWLLRDDLINNEIIFDHSNLSRNVIFNTIHNVVTVILKTDLEDKVLADFKKSAKIINLQCETILALMQFINMILNIEVSQKKSLHEKLFDVNLFKLISRCILHPQSVGLDKRNLRIIELLPAQLEELLIVMTNKLDSLQLDIMMAQLEEDIVSLNLSIDENALNEMISELTEIKGIILLENCKILQRIEAGRQLLSNGVQKVTQIFNLLVTKDRQGTSYCVELESEKKTNLECILRLLLNQEMRVETIITVFIRNEIPLERNDKKIISHGEYFFHTFKDTISRFLINNMAESIELVTNLVQENTDTVFTIMEEWILWVMQHKKEFEEIQENFADTIISKFSKFECAINNYEARKKSFINIYKTVVHLKRNPLDISVKRGPMYTWILNELLEISDLSKTAQMLDNFLICLVGEDSEDFHELKVILRQLRICRGDGNLIGQEGNGLMSAKAMECFQTLLTLLPNTKSTIVLYATINFAMGAAKFLCNDATTAYLNKYFQNIPAARALKSLGEIYRLFINTVPTNERFDVLEYFLLPAVKCCSPLIIEQFFDENIQNIFQSIAQKLTGNHVDCERLIVSKIGCYNLIELLFLNINLNKVNEKYANEAKEMLHPDKLACVPSKQIFKGTFELRKLKTDVVGHRDILRLLHCAAFNCCITIASVAKDEAHFLGLFAENRAKDQLIWERIVDCEKRYQLAQTTKEFPKKRKILVNIRQAMKNKDLLDFTIYSHIKSYNLASSTLSDDIYAYDFSEIKLLPQSSTPTISVVLEEDDLNNHQCMAPICAILRIMSVDNNADTSEQERKKPPKALSVFAGSMASSQYNVQLFMLKIVLNNQSVFKPFAEKFLLPTICIITSMLTIGSMNYIITDALLMLIDWAEVATPKRHREEAQKMFNLVTDKVDSGASTEYIVRYNFSIIELLVKSWYECLDIPAGFYEKMSNIRVRAIRLILIYLSNKMADKLIRRDDVLEFLVTSLEKNWHEKEEIVLQTCEAIGLFLKFQNLELLTDVITKESTIAVRIRHVLEYLQTANPDRLVKCIHSLCQAYPSLVEIFFEYIMYSNSRISSANKAKALQVFCRRIPDMLPTDIRNDLAHLKFHDLLKNKDKSCEKVCLEIIDSLVPMLNSTEFLPFADLASVYSVNDNLEYRELTYNIFINVYKKYSQDITEDCDSQRLVNMSKRILLPGLLDSSLELQQKLTTFWTEETNLSDKCTERIQDIFEVYSADVEHDFLSILTILFLSLTKKSPMYRKKMFEPLLKSCNFRNYEIAISWRMKNLSYRVPLFASSYASQYSQRFTLSSLASDNLLSTYDGLMVRATQLSQLEESLTNKTSVTETFQGRRTQHDDVFVAPELPIRNVISRRFPKKLSEQYSLYTKKPDSFIARQDARQQQTIKQRNSVQLKRLYRIGDFPDIEITHESILDPLQELIKKDQLVCKDLVVSMLRSLLKQIQNISRTRNGENDEFIRNFGKKLDNVLENRRGNGLIISAILEIMFYMEDIKFDTNVVARVSKVTGFNHLGTLLLENNLITERGDQCPPAKRARKAVEYGSSKTEQWVQLAELYQSINDVDIVMSVFQNHVPEWEELRRASAARIVNKWEKALDEYEKMNDCEIEAVRRHCHQGTFECLGRLSDWDQIVVRLEANIATENKLEHYLKIADSVDEGWMSRWYFQAWIYQILTRVSDENDRDVFLDNLMASLQVPEIVQRLKKLFAEEMAVICPIEYHEQSRDFINSALDQVREQWSQLSPLASTLRAFEAIKLRGICNIDMFRKAAKDPNSIQSTLIQYWSNSLPRAQDDLMTWDRHIAYRFKFRDELVERLKENHNSQGDTISELSLSVNKLQLKMIEVAYKQKNISCMKKHWNYVDVEATRTNGLYNCLALNRARFYMLRAEMADQSESIQYYSKCWKNAEKVLQDDDSDEKTRIAVRHLISDLASAIINIDTVSSRNFCSIALTIDKFIVTYRDNPDDVIGSLYQCSFAHLKAACLESIKYSLEQTKIADCHLKLLKFCHKQILADRANQEVIKEFVRSTLQAMQYGSREAAQYFPCLLKVLNDEEVKRTFIVESQKVPSWRFLGWHTQLLSYLSSSLETVVVPIVEKLIEDYPNALVYTLRLIIETNPNIENHPIIAKFTRRHLCQPELEKFIKAMQYLVQPELFLDYNLKKFMDNSIVEKETKVHNLLQLVYPEPQKIPLQGKLYKCIAKFEEEIKRLKEMSLDDVKNHVQNLRITLKQMLEKGKDSRYLKDYSPWLSQFNGSHIEIPGQYTGERKPLSEYHTKIMKFESRVQVMKSSRKPVKITIVGNDAKNYNFLVKFGEDLRLDERVQQAFNIMNEILHADIPCIQRNLSIQTYQVITFSTSVGLIQWIDNTRTLNDYVDFTLSDEKRKCFPGLRDYEEWIGAASSSRQLEIQYKEALIKYNAHAVDDKMKQLTKQLRWDLLRCTFLMLSPSLESFMSVRRNFLMTYATMCIAQWILGVGDRHLENTLISVESGKCTGIDFASAFGAGIDQSVPELVPFRLTNQIRGLMRPFNENDGFGGTMIHVLRAIRNNYGPLIAYLNVVTTENLNWKAHVQELSSATQNPGREVTWLPTEKINTVAKKLSGAKPSDIMRIELKNQHRDSKYYPRYVEIICGSERDDQSVRYTMREDGLTVEQQVQCLLEQATDSNVLGRMYSGWRPWI